MANARPDFNNILIIHFGQLGDVVLGLPALYELRDHFSAAKITVLVGKVPDELVEIAGVADEVIAIDRVALRDGPRLHSISEIFRLARRIRSLRFDLAIDLHSLPETNILAWLSGAKYRLLANRESRSIDLLSNFRPEPPREDKKKHLAQRYLDVIAPLGIKPSKDLPVLPALRTDKSGAVSAASEVELAPVVGLFPGAGHPSRRWPLANFASLAGQLLGAGIAVAVVLGPEETGLVDEVDRTFPDGVRRLSGLSITELIAAASRMSVFVTNDTGAMHLAACAGTPILLLLDERAPLSYTPLVEKYRIVKASPIDAIEVARVLNEIKTHFIDSE